jgi:hypothetical protein
MFGKGEREIRVSLLLPMILPLKDSDLNNFHFPKSKCQQLQGLRKVPITILTRMLVIIEGLQDQIGTLTRQLIHPLDASPQEWCEVVSLLNN